MGCSQIVKSTFRFVSRVQKTYKKSTFRAIFKDTQIERQQEYVNPLDGCWADR